MEAINIKLLDYTDLIGQIDYFATKMVEDYLAGSPKNEDEAKYLESLRMERGRRAATGEFNDHRDNA